MIKSMVNFDQNYLNVLLKEPEKIWIKLTLCGNVYQNPTNRKLLNPTSVQCSEYLDEDIKYSRNKNVVFKYYFWTFLLNCASRCRRRCFSSKPYRIYWHFKLWIRKTSIRHSARSQLDILLQVIIFQTVLFFHHFCLWYIIWWFGKWHSLKFDYPILCNIYF